MGVFTLADFRNHVVAATGPRGSSNEFLDLHINAAYLDICTDPSLNADALIKIHTATLALDTLDFILPDRVIEVIALVDETNNRRLMRESMNNYYKRDRGATAGDALYWTRDGEALHIWPKLDTSTDFACVFKQEPAKLSAVSDVSVLDTRFDTIIVSLASAYAVMALAQTEEEIKKAEAYERRARGLMRRFGDETEDYESTMTGVSVPTSWADLRDQETG